MEELDVDSSGPLLLTPEGHQRLQDELTRLTMEKRAEIAERIRESRDHGEFSEDNNELDEVKQEQAIVENRITELRTVLSNADILALDQIPTDHVGLGSRVRLSDPERKIEFEIRLVASIEANPDQDLVSDDSPLGHAVLGRKVGEVVEFDAPAGRLRYGIKAISR